MFRQLMGFTQVAMRNSPRLTRWDQASAQYLQSRRALGRAYSSEQWILGTVRRCLHDGQASNLDLFHFDRWRQTLRHLNPNTRRGRERVIYNFCFAR